MKNLKKLVFDVLKSIKEKKKSIILMKGLDKFIKPCKEHWGIGFKSNPNEKLQLQAVNCNCCGNYIQHSLSNTLFRHIIFSDNIYCKCRNHIGYDSEEYDSEEDDIWQRFYSIDNVQKKGTKSF